LCGKCGDNEPGQRIAELKDLEWDLKGYTNKAASEKKILRNVFKKGDAWYLSGDLLKRDAEGYFYFVDRIGDTFRWKGENVATGEVESVINDFPGVKEVNVYGVAMPKTSGRAGMAYMIVEHDKFDLKNFYDFVQAKLPAYAAPLFIRLGKEIEVTSTLKYMKTARRDEGFNPDKIKEPLYFRDCQRTKSYVPLSHELFNKIMNDSLEAKL